VYVSLFENLQTKKSKNTNRDTQFFDSDFQFDQHGNYYPIIFVNEFWIMREHLTPINETVMSLPLGIVIHLLLVHVLICLFNFFDCKKSNEQLLCDCSLN
jgi:hypothetical protein